MLSCLHTFSISLSFWLCLLPLLLFAAEKMRHWQRLPGQASSDADAPNTGVALASASFSWHSCNFLPALSLSLSLSPLCHLFGLQLNLPVCLSAQPACLYTHAEDSRAGLGVAHGSCYAPSTSLKGGYKVQQTELKLCGRRQSSRFLHFYRDSRTVSQVRRR